MQKKGEMKIATPIMIAVGVIVALIILQIIAQYTGGASGTVTVTNSTYTLSTTGYTDIQGMQEVIGDYVIYNSSAVSGGLAASNITLVERVGDDGLKTVSIRAIDSRWNGKNVNVTAVYGVDGYVDDSASRSIVSLIVLISALAIAVFVLVPSLREEVVTRFT